MDHKNRIAGKKAAIQKGHNISSFKKRKNYLKYKKNLLTVLNK